MICFCDDYGGICIMIPVLQFMLLIVGVWTEKSATDLSCCSSSELLQSSD